MARRRARRATARQSAAAAAKAEKSIAVQLEKDVRKKVARGLQEFAVKSMNTLAQQGPAWTGEFSASWGFAPEGRTPQTPGTTGRIYRYGRKDVPVRDLERFLKDGVTRFSIANTAPHAGIATDEVESMFSPPEFQIDPIGENISYGTGRPDQEHLRWQIANDPGEDITSQITAEKDWFPNYLRGGKFQKDLNDGFSFGFEVLR